VTNSRPLLLDASVLVAYERELTRRAQAFVVQVLALSSMNALDVGTLAARAGALDAVTLELAEVGYEAAGIRAIVLTYEPKLYQGQSVDVMDMRPR
jgi:hypothetical protein